MRKVILVLLLCQITLLVQADYLVTNRKTSIKAEPDRNSDVIIQVEDDTKLTLLDDGAKESGYYHVRAGRTEGWIFQTFVRRVRGNISTTTISTVTNEEPVAADGTLEKKYMPRSKSAEQLVEHEGYISCMSREFNVPSWVYHKVSSELLRGDKQTRGSTYPKDDLYPALKTKAYEGSGYDHGHLAPAADFKRDENLYQQSFLMTNMSPQHGCFNQKGWCMLESNVREWAKQRPASEFYIFSGSIIDDNTQDWLCIGDVVVTVPSSFFKVVAERRNGKFVKGIAFLVPNGDINGNEMETTRATIDEVEELTGLNFFPQISSTEESNLEKRIGDYTLAPSKECGKSNTPCDRVYGERVFPENRTKLVCTE